MREDRETADRGPPSGSLSFTIGRSTSDVPVPEKCFSGGTYPWRDCCELFWRSTFARSPITRFQRGWLDCRGKTWPNNHVRILRLRWRGASAGLEETVLPFYHTAITPGGFCSKRILFAHAVVVGGGFWRAGNTGVVSGASGLGFKPMTARPS